jgi:hypothetical protein
MTFPWAFHEPVDFPRTFFPLVNIEKTSNNYGKSPFSMGKLTNFMVIFLSYFDMTRGQLFGDFLWIQPTFGKPKITSLLTFGTASHYGVLGKAAHLGSYTHAYGYI